MVNVDDANLKPANPAAAILCGGLGSRLRDALPGLPKTLAPIAGRPFLDYLLLMLVANSVERIVLCIGVGASAIRKHILSRDWGAEIIFSEESSPLGTGGALGFARPQLSSDPVLVLNGDSWVDGLDLCSFFRSHQCHALPGSVVVVPQDARTDTGSFHLDSAGRIGGFAEKSELSGAKFQNAGIYLLNQELVAMIPAGQPSSLERDCMPRWIEAGVQGFVQMGQLIDIGTPERLAQAQQRLVLENW